MANNIKEIREKIGMTQLELCEILNISQPTLANKEAGKRGFTAKELLILEKVLGVSISEMFEDWNFEIEKILNAKL